MPLVLFAGTSEGRTLAERLCQNGLSPLVCVATEYGGSLLADLPLEVLAGRLDAAAMAALLRQRKLTTAVDATHPYADLVSTNLRAACAETGCRYLRLARPSQSAEDALWVEDVAGAAALLEARGDRALLAIGSKALGSFTGITDFAQRLYPRVLPLPEVVQDCLALGYRADHLIAMQGPFSPCLNEALLRQYQLTALVTKETGAAGGFAEKVEAARKAKAALIVIGRPPEPVEGLSPDELLALLLA